MLAGGQSFVLGSHAVAISGGDDDIPGFAAEPGDAASLIIDRSALIWPTPFDFNFMTGRSPSWKRHLYYRLSWRKASGARLDVLWKALR